MAFCVLCGHSVAQLPLARLDRVTPLGTTAGVEVALEIQGRDLDDCKTLHFDHVGFKAEWVKANHFKVTVAADVPAGTYEVRAVGRFGITGVRLFQVSHGLADVKEVEPNDAPDKAQAVPMNAAVNGTSGGNGDDFFRFPAKKGERVTLETFGYRLDSQIRAVLSVLDSGGRVLAAGKPYYYRTDPLIDFTAPADGDYLVRLHDHTFSGGHPYRLVVSNLPHVENAFPAAVEPGKKADLTLWGRNLPGGKPAPTDPPLDQASVSYTPPADLLTKPRFDFLQHLASPSLNAVGVQWRPEKFLNPVTLAVADAPIVLDREPNDTADAAQPITLPAVVCGRFDRPGDADWYSFTARAGEAFAVDLLCDRLGMPGDPFVIISDAKGAELGTFDDHGANVNALAQFNRDPLGVFRAPADGAYLVFVQDRYRQGGPRHGYVLRLVKSAPDFFPVAFHETNPDPTCPLVRQGGSAFLEVFPNRREFNGPLTITASDLPKGVTCPPIQLWPSQQAGVLVFTAAADAPEWAGPIRLTASATIDGKKVERAVRGCQRRWAVANIDPSIMTRQICLAVRPDAAYAIALPAPPLTVAAGGTLETTAAVKRFAKDFAGKVQLNGLMFPNGFTMVTTDVPSEKDAAPIKIAVAANVPPGEYTLVLRGDAQVPYHRDAKMATRPLVRVADPSTPLTVVVTAAAKK